MSPKTAIFWGLTIGSIIGGWIPSIFGADLFSYSGAIGSTIGALLGIYLAAKLTMN